MKHTSSFIKFVFLVIIELNISCIYSYKSNTRRVSIDNTPEINSSGEVSLFVQFSGGSSDLFYISRKKLPDSLVGIAAGKYFSRNKSTRDSIKKAGIHFISYAQGCGWREYLKKNHLEIENEEIAKIDTVYNVFVDNLIYQGSVIGLKIFKNGKTIIYTDKNRNALKISITILNDTIIAEGEYKKKVRHKRSFLAYVLDHL